ncbi:MAG: alpha-hydroxy-acid oxidizing protein [Planctomycetota bacterium]|nr:MAG: alpha-hydroxy-acid oxidizing protein [Planctomycetota bacterium]GDY08757.1 alpha-hydroxy-acid oxidizing enzyme [Planctomycetia bacterium]
MNRRFFSQLLALGAGSLGLWQARARADEELAQAPAGGTQKIGGPPNPRRLEPVNVADFQELAKAALPPATYDYITSGSTDEVTLRDNVAAFQRLRLLPPLLTGVAEVDTATTVLKQPIALPILLAPVAGQNLYHPQGALASARAAASAKTILGVSSSVGHSVEEIAAASTGPKWFQLYMPKDRAVARRLVERAERAGFKAIVLTVDLGERKDADKRNRFTLPEPALRKHLRDIGFDLSEQMTYKQLLAFNDQAWDLTLSWNAFDWLRSITKLPLLVKGVLRADDAKKAVAIGLNGIVVSNHGGRRLDGVPASIDQLPQIVAAVNGKAEVLLDSGIRRGTDVLKALALGAKAVLIGRPYAWALAADGEAGVSKILELLREELVSAMLASGCPNVASIDRSLLVS